MDLNAWLTIIGMIITGIVGVILYRQIKSQKDIIKHYKGLVGRLDPKNVLILKDAEIEQMKRIADNDVNNLKGEVVELANYVDTLLTMYENMAKEIGHPESFNRQRAIDRNLPKSANLLNEIHKTHQSSSKAPSA